MMVFAKPRIKLQVFLCALVQSRSQLRLLVLFPSHYSIILKCTKTLICLLAEGVLHLEHFQVKRQEYWNQVDHGADLRGEARRAEGLRNEKRKRSDADQKEHSGHIEVYHFVHRIGILWLPLVNNKIEGKTNEQAIY